MLLIQQGHQRALRGKPQFWWRLRKPRSNSEGPGAIASCTGVGGGGLGFFVYNLGTPAWGQSVCGTWQIKSQTVVNPREQGFAVWGSQTGALSLGAPGVQNYGDAGKELHVFWGNGAQMPEKHWYTFWGVRHIGQPHPETRSQCLSFLEEGLALRDLGANGWDHTAKSLGDNPQ